MMRAAVVRQLVTRRVAQRWLCRLPRAHVASTAMALHTLWRGHGDTPATGTTTTAPPPPPPSAATTTTAGEQHTQPSQPSSRAADDGGAVDEATLELPGVAMAHRVVRPSATYPATPGDDEPYDPRDPRVAWREFYSLEHRRPYYHNVRTDEVTYDIPDGFITRFPRYYRTRGYVVDARGAVSRPSQSSQPPTPGDGDSSNNSGTTTTTCATGATASLPTRPLTTRQKLAAYGAGGLLWYLIIHNISLVCVFTCMYVFRINIVEVARSYGVRIAKPSVMHQADGSDGNGGETTTQTRPQRPALWRTLLASFVLNKMLVPAHALLTVATAPFIMHRMTPIAAAMTPRCQRLVQRMRAALRSPLSSPPAS